MNEHGTPSQRPVQIEHKTAVAIVPARKTSTLVLGVISGALGLFGVLIPGLHLVGQVVNNDFTYANAVGFWCLFSLAPIVGVLLGVFGLKEKGYQHASDRILLITMISLNMLSFAIPVVATVYYFYR